LIENKIATGRVIVDLKTDTQSVFFSYLPKQLVDNKPILEMKNFALSQIKIFSLLVFSVATTTLARGANRAQVEVYFEGLEDHIVLVEIISLTKAFSESKRIHLRVREGYLRYALPTKDTVQLSITPASRMSTTPHGKPYALPEQSIDLFLLPNSQAVVRCQVLPNKLTYTASGSPLSQEYAQFRNQQLADQVALREVSIQHRRITVSAGYLEAIRLSIMARAGMYEGEVPTLADSASRLWNQMKALEDRMQQRELEYIRTNGDQALAGWLLAKQPMDTLAEYYDRLSGEAVQGVFKHLVDYQYAYLKTQGPRPSRALNVSVGDLAPTFQIMLRGQAPYMLEPIPGKHIVLDFWGSFCKPCIEEFPRLKEYYGTYGDELEIIGLPVDSRSGWERMVEKHQLPWPNVFPVNENFQNKALELYNVTSFPTKIIIDPEGAIVGIYVGSQEGFYKQLDNILGI